MLVSLSPAGASALDEDQTQRQQIAAQRQAAAVQFKSQEAACYQKFAAQDCLKEVALERRRLLADLRRQEISLNDARRKRLGVAQVQRLEQRQASESPKSE
ncbi:MAG: hypothetical protein ACKVOO_12860 [Burkholderiaceae bacterium]